MTSCIGPGYLSPVLFRREISAITRILAHLENDSFLAEIADQVKGYSEGYDILEQKQAQITHVPHSVNPWYGNNRAGGSYDHSAGRKEHDR